jgi:hypothetical protein
MRRKTPQQKKAESYAKDRRNAYRNSDKAARSAIPKRRQQRNQAERRLAKQELGGTAAAADESRVDSMLSQVRLERLKAWKKTPDEPLGRVLARKGKLRSADR